ncbi:hypothetical protein ACH4LE_15520 [Streptomyces sp. NPDC017413]|uniref:hypothetical protein n=1 Tax=Streptomyces sp. NPDC017413 TaxID=3364994 RepID=UPI003790CF00
MAYEPVQASRNASTRRRNRVKRGRASSRPGPSAAGGIGPGMTKGRKAVEVSHGALGVLDDTEGLLGDRALNYARRGAE